MTEEQDYKHDLFISYNRADEGWAEQLAARLEQEDYRGRKLKVFFAPWDIPPGEYITESLEEALPQSRKVALVVTPEAMRSEWVKIERLVTTHIDIEEHERRLIPLYRRAPGKLPALLRGIRAIDFEEDAQFEKGYRELLAAVRGEPLPRGGRGEASKGVLPPSSVPRPPSFGFVSRRDEQGRDIVERLKEELAPGRDQLVTLSGPGGIGKTTLAAEAARELQATYGGRVVWSSADGRADFTFPSLLDDIATQLGSAGLRTLAPAEKEEQVRAAASGALVVLDNYETVAAAEQKRIEAWLKRTQCSALFTSRPKVPGTVFVPVSAMSREEAAEFLEKLTAQTQDPQLFTPEVREQVFGTAEANPYVMQWVVAQIDDAKEPATVFEELAGGEGDAAERVFARSFDLPRVGDDGRAALLALSLFARNASREALAEVAGLGEDRTRLDEAVRHLHALWLVKGVDGNRRLAVEGLTRTLAAARRSEDPRADEFRRRFVAYFLRYTIESKEPTPENYEALEAERENLLGAAETAYASGEWGSVMRMASALAHPADGMLSVRGYWDEAVRLGEQALKAAHSAKDEAGIAVFSHNVAVMYGNRGELAQARRLYGESLEINKRLGNQSGVAGTTSQLGIVHQLLGEFEEAKVKHEESLAIRRKLGEQHGIAIDLHELGVLAQDAGEIEEARRLYVESLEIKKRLGDQSGIAITLHQLGVLAQGAGEMEEARRLYGESLEIVMRLGDQSGIASTFHQLGVLAEDAGEKAEAARLFREALGIFERLGSPNAEIARGSLTRVE
ncbi:MAG TPA: tetratricopeptide repeat protein, partial [Pyrinomonadaceae bacterium]